MIKAIKKRISTWNVNRINVAKQKLYQTEMTIRALEDRKFKLIKQIKWMQDHKPSTFENLVENVKNVAGIGVAIAGFFIARDLTPFDAINHAIIDKGIEAGRHIEKSGIKRTGNYTEDLANLEKALKRIDAEILKEDLKFSVIAENLKQLSKITEAQLHKRSLKITLIILAVTTTLTLILYTA